jgi:hypothetical protein
MDGSSKRPTGRRAPRFDDLLRRLVEEWLPWVSVQAGEAFLCARLHTWNPSVRKTAISRLHRALLGKVAENLLKIYGTSVAFSPRRSPPSTMTART